MSISERIIEEVKSHPVLYDLFHPDYKNIRAKNKIWDELGKSLNTEGDDVKKKWKNLRDAFAKHIRSEKTHTGQKSKTIDRYKTWPWAQQMAFFRPFLEFSQTDSNIEHNRDFNNTSELEDGLSEIQWPPPVVVLNEEPPKRAAIQSPCKTNLVKRTRCEENTKTSPVEKVLTYLLDRQSQHDEIELLFMGHAKTVKKFSARRQTMVKFKIAKLLMEEELQQQLEDENATVSRLESQ